MRRRSLLFIGAATVAASTAQAAGPLGRDGDRIETSQYAVDPTAGVVLAGTRVTGLAGAYVAIAEGVDGNAMTPVAPAVRPAYSVDHFDYDLGLGVTLPATLTSTDYFNTGRGTTQLSDAQQDAAVFVTPAVNLQWGELGVGVLFEFSNYGLTRRPEPVEMAAERESLSAVFSSTHFQFAHMLFDRQLIAGAGLRVSSLSVSNDTLAPEEQNLFSTTGAGIELGALFTPQSLPFRAGIAFRSAVTTRVDPNSRVPVAEGGDRVIGDPTDPDAALYLPERVSQPWDLNVGIALAIGKRPLNPRWVDPSDRTEPVERAHDYRARERRRHRGEGGDTASGAAADAENQFEDALDELGREHLEEDSRQALKRRYRALSRRLVLVSMSLLVTGPVDDAVGVEGFVQRRVARAGQAITLSPRLGVETEIVPHWMKVRIGTYGEPARFATGRDRLHATVGFDTKLFAWTVFDTFEEDTEWRFGAALDAARRYLGWGVSVGVWH